MLVFPSVTFFTDIFEKLKSLHTLRQTLWSITALIPQMCLLPSHTLSLKIITDHSIKHWKVAVCTWYDLQRFGGGWLPTSQVSFCKERGPGQRVWAELVLQPNLPRARWCFGTGTPRRKSPSWSRDAAREEHRGKRNKAKVARTKGTNQALNERTGVWGGSRLGRRKGPKKAVEKGRRCRQWDSGEAGEEGKLSGQCRSWWLKGEKKRSRGECWPEAKRARGCRWVATGRTEAAEKKIIQWQKTKGISISTPLGLNTGNLRFNSPRKWCNTSALQIGNWSQKRVRPKIYKVSTNASSLTCHSHNLIFLSV